MLSTSSSNSRVPLLLLLLLLLRLALPIGRRARGQFLARGGTGQRRGGRSLLLALQSVSVLPPLFESPSQTLFPVFSVHRESRERLKRTDFDDTIASNDDLLETWEKRKLNASPESKKGKAALALYGASSLRGALQFSITDEDGETRWLLAIVLVTPQLVYCRCCRVKLKLNETLKLDGIWQHLETGHVDVSLHYCPGPWKEGGKRCSCLLKGQVQSLVTTGRVPCLLSISQ